MNEFFKNKVTNKVRAATLSWGKFKSEERVNLAISMTDTCIRVCAEGIRHRNQALTEEEVKEMIRERIMYARRRASEV